MKKNQKVQQGSCYIIESLGALGDCILHITAHKIKDQNCKYVVNLRNGLTKVLWLWNCFRFFAFYSTLAIFLKLETFQRVNRYLIAFQPKNLRRGLLRGLGWALSLPPIQGLTNCIQVLAASKGYLISKANSKLFI